MAASLDFRSERFYLFLIYKTYLLSFKSISLPLMWKNRKIDFPDTSHGGHIRYSIETILADFDVLVSSMLPTKFQKGKSPGSATITSRSPSLTRRKRGIRQNQNKRKSNKRTKSTKISSLFPERYNRNAKRSEQNNARQDLKKNRLVE